MKFKKIAPKELKENPFTMIDNEWMLITGAVDGKCNTMTASWGLMGVLWEKLVCEVFLRPQRYTLEFLDKADTFTLTVFDEKYRAALDLLGTESGRDSDKIKKSGLTPFEISAGSVAFEEARLIIVLKKIYRDELNRDLILAPEVHDLYEGDYHKLFIGEILDCYAAE